MASPFIIWTLSVLLLVASLFMILLVLVQRGRGGGLAGAFGGMGGQSALGVRAGDIFTKITVVVAVVFILIASLLGISMRDHQRDVDEGKGGPFTAGAAADEDESSEDSDVPVMTADEDAEIDFTDAESAVENDNASSENDGAKAGNDADADAEESADGDPEDTRE